MTAAPVGVGMGDGASDGASGGGAGTAADGDDVSVREQADTGTRDVVLRVITDAGVDGVSLSELCGAVFCQECAQSSDSGSDASPHPDDGAADRADRADRCVTHTRVAAAVRDLVAASAIRRVNGHHAPRFVLPRFFNLWTVPVFTRVSQNRLRTVGRVPVHMWTRQVCDTVEGEGEGEGHARRGDNEVGRHHKGQVYQRVYLGVLAAVLCRAPIAEVRFFSGWQ